VELPGPVRGRRNQTFFLSDHEDLTQKYGTCFCLTNRDPASASPAGSGGVWGDPYLTTRKGNYRRHAWAGAIVVRKTSWNVSFQDENGIVQAVSHFGTFNATPSARPPGHCYLNVIAPADRRGRPTHARKLRDGMQAKLDKARSRAVSRQQLLPWSMSSGECDLQGKCDRVSARDTEKNVRRESGELSTGFRPHGVKTAVRGFDPLRIRGPFEGDLEKRPAFGNCWRRYRRKTLK